MGQLSFRDDKIVSVDSIFMQALHVNWFLFLKPKSDFWLTFTMRKDFALKIAVVVLTKIGLVFLTRDALVKKMRWW